jgi:hypothetical protein
LHQCDLDLLEHIPLRDLVCLRRGEPAHDPRTGGLPPLGQELLKIRGKGMGWECVNFKPTDNACAIYVHRPLECRTLSCTDCTALFEAMAAPTLSRSDLVCRPSALWDCIEEHESRFSVEQAMALTRCMSGLTISVELDRMIRHELSFRRSLAHKAQACDEDLWAYLGRPLWLILVPVNPSFARYGS